MLKVYGVSPSPYVRKVLCCLDLKNVEYSLEPVMPGMAPEGYAEISPLNKIPAIDHDGFVLSDSSVICEYLNDTFMDASIYPEGIQQKAKARWFEEYADSKLAELASGIFFERVMKKIFKRETDEARLEKIIETELPKQLDYLESIVQTYCGEASNNAFLFGDNLLLADIALCTHFFNAEFAGYSLDESRWPLFTAYFKRVKAHPVVANRLEEDAAFMASF